jgi:hypothetical protein
MLVQPFVDVIVHEVYADRYPLTNSLRVVLAAAVAAIAKIHLD